MIYTSEKCLDFQKLFVYLEYLFFFKICWCFSKFFHISKKIGISKFVHKFRKWFTCSKIVHILRKNGVSKFQKSRFEICNRLQQLGAIVHQRKVLSSFPLMRALLFHNFDCLSLPTCDSGYFQIPKRQGVGESQRTDGKALVSSRKRSAHQSVAQAIQVYSMACFRLPRGLCENVTSIIRQFWWGSKRGKIKPCWVS